MNVWSEVLAEPLNPGVGLSTILGLGENWSTVLNDLAAPIMPAAITRRAERSFLVTSAARTVGIEEVVGLSDAEALAMMRRLRWPDGLPTCPRCESCDCNELPRRKSFRCRDCYYEFGVMTYTTWHGAKLTARQILIALFLFSTAPKGLSAVNLSLWLKLDWKTVYLMQHKVREAIFHARARLKLMGIVEIDGVYFRRKRRPPNLGRQGVAHNTSHSRCVLSLVQRGGPTLAVVCDGETKAAVIAAIRKHVAEGAILMTDKAPCYGFLRAFFETHAVNHSVEFARGEVFTNSAESFHARLRRAQRGAYHRFAGPAFELYMAELAYRHSYSDRDTRSSWEDMTAITLGQLPSSFKGY